MSENNPTVNKPETTGNDQGRTFTQAEMDAIIGDRLARERAKYSDYEEVKAKAAKFDKAEEAQKTELQKATEKVDSLTKQLDAIKAESQLQSIRTKVAEEMKVPVSLLTGSDEESCKAQAQTILDFANPQPTSKVEDKGEVRVSGGAKTTREMFADAFNDAFGK